MRLLPQMCHPRRCTADLVRQCGALAAPYDGSSPSTGDWPGRYLGTSSVSSLYPCPEIRRNPFGRLPVPKLRDSMSAIICRMKSALECLGVWFNELIRPFADCDRTLRIAPQGEAGNAEGRGFLLNAARIGHDHTRVCHEAQKSTVRKG